MLFSFPSISSNSIRLLFFATTILGFAIGAAPVPLGYRITVLVLGLLFLLVLIFKVSDSNEPEVEAEIEDSDEEFRNELSLLKEAAAFFSASLSQDEMRLLLCSRISSLLDDSVIAIATPKEEGFELSESEIPDIPLTRDLVEVASLSNDVVTVEDLQRKNDSFDLFLSAAPLKRGRNLIGVLLVSPRPGTPLPQNQRVIAIADVAGSLLSGAQNFELTASNALRDGLTNLPNARAMRVILEQQIAESERYGFERKLSILVIDIKGFDDFNAQFGHVEGDRLLSYVAQTLSSCVRKMDYVSRVSSDEFILIMPKVDSKKKDQVVERIHNGLRERTFETRCGFEYDIEIDFGFAVYGEDAFDGASLVQKAIERKEVSRRSQNGDVLMFPQRKAKESIHLQ